MAMLFMLMKALLSPVVVLMRPWRGHEKHQSKIILILIIFVIYYMMLLNN